MGLDSVELVLAWEDALGITIEDAEAEFIQTSRGAIDLFAAKLGACDHERGACLTLRAFNRVRSALMDGAGVPRSEVRPGTRLDDLFPRRERASRWRAVQDASGALTLPNLRIGLGILRVHKTVADISHWIVSHSPRELKATGECWTRAEIRTIVRTIVTEQLGVYEFSDDAEFVRDLGMD